MPYPGQWEPGQLLLWKLWYSRAMWNITVAKYAANCVSSADIDAPTRRNNWNRNHNVIECPVATLASLWIWINFIYQVSQYPYNQYGQQWATDFIVTHRNNAKVIAGVDGTECWVVPDDLFYHGTACGGQANGCQEQQAFRQHRSNTTLQHTRLPFNNEYII